MKLVDAAIAKQEFFTREHLDELTRVLGGDRELALAARLFYTQRPVHNTFAFDYGVPEQMDHPAVAPAVEHYRHKARMAVLLLESSSTEEIDAPLTVAQLAGILNLG